MKRVISVLAASCVILLVLASGCADVTAKQKVGDFGTAFGTSSDEQKAIDWFKTTYGDPTTNNDQPARFLEPLITTGLSTNNMPVDKVITFPVSGGSIYFFVIYDNFKKGAPITVSWVYMENGKEVTNVQKQAGGDFGRFIVEFQKPDSGWGKGKQRITVTGDGASADVAFNIGDTLQTTPLPYSPSTSVSPTVTGQAVNVGPTVSGTPFQGATIPTTAQAKSLITPDKKGTGRQLTDPVSCSNGQSNCNGICINLNSDPKNCGSCGKVCPENYWEDSGKGLCNAGNCCGWMETVCDNKCSNPDTDNYNCGKCGNRCQIGDSCSHAQCIDIGNTGDNQQQLIANANARCYGISVDLNTDASNCGACKKACPSGKTCWNAVCSS